MTAAPDFPDWLAIANLKARYCRLLDCKDWAGFANLFTDGLVLDATASGGPRFEGRDAAITGVRASIEAAKTAHQVHSPEIEIDGDGAGAIWAMQDRLVCPMAGHLPDTAIIMSAMFAWTVCGRSPPRALRGCISN